MTVRAASYVAALVLAACASEPPPPPKRDPATRRLELVDACAADAMKVLGLEPPVELDDWGYHKDGGTIGFRIQDGAGRRVEACLFANHQPEAFYLGAHHPGLDLRKGERLPYGDPREVALMRLVCWWTAHRRESWLAPELLRRLHDQRPRESLPEPLR